MMRLLRLFKRRRARRPGPRADMAIPIPEDVRELLDAPK
jgi:hypothetical protein